MLFLTGLLTITLTPLFVLLGTFKLIIDMMPYEEDI
jgi:hypothetical protein